MEPRLTSLSSHTRTTRGFTLLELVIVVVIIAVVASIALTRVGAAADNSRSAAISASLQILDRAVQLYAAEHAGRGPATEPDGTVNSDPTSLIARLTGHTDVDGNTGTGNPFGPYLRALPKNPVNGLDTVRIDGASAGKNIAGWRYDSASGIFQAEDSPESAKIQVNETILGDVAASGSVAESVDGP